MDGLRVANTGCRAQGFSLIEVLIAIVVLSFGLLGMVGMQAAALKANRDARLQSTAVGLARELAEMMRGNRIESVKASNNPYLGLFSSPLTPSDESYCLSVGATACAGTPAIANAQMTEWLARVDVELPGAQVEVCFDSAPFNSSGVPQWGCTDGTEAPIVIKIGWTRNSTNSQALELERATIPSVVLPVTPGSAI